MRGWILTAALVMAAGCSETLETGYAPRKLGATSAERRSYYASPFTPESKPPKESGQSDFGNRRPGFGGY